jgi:hypothetical protein
MMRAHYGSSTLVKDEEIARFDQQLQAMDSRESNCTGLNCFEFVLIV